MIKGQLAWEQASLHGWQQRLNLVVATLATLSPPGCAHTLSQEDCRECSLGIYRGRLCLKQIAEQERNKQALTTFPEIQTESPQD